MQGEGRFCHICGSAMVQKAGKQKLYCSDACRQKADRIRRKQKLEEITYEKEVLSDHVAEQKKIISDITTITEEEAIDLYTEFYLMQERHKKEGRPKINTPESEECKVICRQIAKIKLGKLKIIYKNE